MSDRKPLRDWLPYEHVARACDLLDAMDANYDEEGNATVKYVTAPVALSLAMAHVEIANAKMIGGTRA